MPTVYVSGSFKTTILLAESDSFTFDEWTDKALAAERKEYDRSNLGLWLEIENTDDPVSPFSIPVNVDDVYEGSFKVTQDGRSFSFEFNGKSKATVHKITKSKIDDGLKPRLTGLVINGQSFPVDMSIDLTIQSKKL